MGKGVVGPEEHLQPGQAMQVVRQIAQRIATEVEDFQRICQVENFLREFGQSAGQVKTPYAGQLAGAQVCEGMHRCGFGLQSDKRAS